MMAEPRPAQGAFANDLGDLTWTHDQVGVQLGDVLDARFAIQQLAGRGGMATVYRALDLHTREIVAVKVAALERASQVSRFAQEVAVLARLSHPGIVRYLASGETPAGLPYLAMEWLDGETLSQRLARKNLTADESLLLIRRACEALAVAHALGVVHRDLKPSNLFLVDGEVSALKLLDFGIARHNDGAYTITQSGTVLGTVGYMSPEQALGARDVNVRSDVFALGCVLFECLTGRAAFSGGNAVAILAKVLREEPPSLRDARPELGEQLAQLLSAMLAKDPRERPADALALLGMLDSIDLALEPPVSGVVASPLGLTETERKIVAVILGKPRSPDTQTTLAAEATAAETEGAALSSIQQVARRFGAEPVFLRGGAVMVVLSGQGASDQTAQAARCVLQLQRLRPELRFSVATGRAETSAHIPIGAAIERASELLTGDDEPVRGVAIDEPTAALLEQRFVVRREASSLAVLEERSEHEAARLLLGKPTPFVGRDKELGLLDRTLSECIEDSVARVVVVSGAPGQGKSRLRHELIAKLRERSGVRVLLARADPFGARSTFRLARQLVRRAVGVREGDASSAQHTALRAYIAELCPVTDAPRIAEFLGELIGARAPASERISPELRAARNDPQIMSVWLRRAFGDWLAAECAAQPLLLVIEDLHWGDPASVSYLEEALAALAARPLMVLALARPEIYEVFPRLWERAEPQAIRLGRLTPRAAESIVRVVLGQQLSAAETARIVERADGNPFHLEELIRRVSEGDHESLPETVLALVQSRLTRLSPEARRIARAASLFGETFWLGGVRAVLGDTQQDSGASLRALLDDELFSASHTSRFNGEPEYRFRHGLLREAAYCMLTDIDRQSGHALAGAWLEQHGEQDALTLANHFELGGLRERAIPWLLTAAQAAADGGNIDDVHALVQRGIACGAAGESLGQLHLVHAEARVMRGSWLEAIAASREASALLPPGSTQWFKATAGPLLAGTFLGDVSVTAEAVRMVLNVPLNAEPTGPFGLAIFWVSQGLSNASQRAAAQGLLQNVEAMADAAGEADPAFRMWLAIAKSYSVLLDGDLGRGLALLAETRALADRTGSTFGRALAGMYSVAALSQTGHAERTGEAARAAFAISEPTGLHVARDWSAYFFALACMRSGAPQLDAQVIAPLRALCERADHRLAVSAHNILALALLDRGQTEEARQHAVAASEGARFPLEHATVLSVCSRLELQLGDAPRALELAERGLEAAAQGIFPWTGTMLYLGRARALHALERVPEAHAAIQAAGERVLRIAATVDDAELRESCLTQVDCNAETLALAREWLGARALDEASVRVA